MGGCFSQKIEIGYKQDIQHEWGGMLGGRRQRRKRKKEEKDAEEEGKEGWERDSGRKKDH